MGEIFEECGGEREREIAIACVEWSKNGERYGIIMDEELGEKECSNVSNT